MSEQYRLPGGITNLVVGETEQEATIAVLREMLQEDKARAEAFQPVLDEVWRKLRLASQTIRDLADQALETDDPDKALELLAEMRRLTQSDNS